MVAAAPGAVVILASTSFDGHRLYDQRLAAALAQHGPVLYVNPAVPVFGIGRAPAATQPPRPAGVTVVTPKMLPFGRRPLLAPVTAVVVAVTVWAALLRHRGARIRDTGVIVAAGHPVSVSLLRALPLVYLVKDDYVAGAELINIPAERLRRRRQRLLALVDRVVVVSPALRATLLRAGVRAVVIPPGADDVTDPVADAAPALVTVGRPRAAFIGMVSDRIDLSMLTRLTELDVEVVIAGRQQSTFSEHQAWNALLATGRVHVLGHLEPHALTAVLQACDIGLVPYQLTPFNLASFPLKTLEYLAAGMPVLASDLPALRWLACDDVVIVDDAASVDGCVAEVLHRSRQQATAARCRAFAARHAWPLRAEQFRAVLADIG